MTARELAEQFKISKSSVKRLLRVQAKRPTVPRGMPPAVPNERAGTSGARVSYGHGDHRDHSPSYLR